MSTAEESARIKTLRLRLARADVLCSSAEEESRAAQKRWNEAAHDVSKLKKELAKLQASKDVVFSEHAMLRYLERIEFVNMQRVYDRVMTPELVAKIQTLGTGFYPVDNFYVRTRENTIVTVLTEAQYLRKTVNGVPAGPRFHEEKEDGT